MKRVAIPVSEELIEKLEFIPTGVRSEVIRHLLRILVATQESNMNIYVAEDLLQDRLVLVKRDQVKEGVIPEAYNVTTT